MVLELEKSGRSPVIFLKKPEGSDVPVVANLFGDRSRIARIAGARNGDFNSAWLRVLDHLKPPRLSVTGPIHEFICLGDEVDATTLPVSRHFAQDAGQYVNAGILVCKDPDTGVRDLVRGLEEADQFVTVRLAHRQDLDRAARARPRSAGRGGDRSASCGLSRGVREGRARG